MRVAKQGKMIYLSKAERDTLYISAEHEIIALVRRESFTLANGYGLYLLILPML